MNSSISVPSFQVRFYSRLCLYVIGYVLCCQWLKWFCEAGGGAHLTKPGWSKPHTHSNPANLRYLWHKITLYRFNQGDSYYCRGLKWEQGAEPP